MNQEQMSPAQLSQQEIGETSAQLGREDEQLLNESPQAAPDQGQQGQEAPALNLLGGPRELPPGTPSFVLADVLFGQSLYWNPAGHDTSVDISGDFKLLKFWHHSITGIDYFGGGSFYPEDSLSDTQQIQRLTVAQQFLWRRRHLTLADAVGNSNSGGSFGTSLFGGGELADLIFGGTGATTSSSLGLSLFTGSTTFVAGIGSQTINVAEAEFTNELTPRSALTVLGAYGASYYSGSNPNYIDSRAISAAVQYAYVISPRSTVGVLYGYQHFQYPLSTEGTLANNVVQLVYQRVLSPKMSVGFGAGPQLATSTSEVIFPIFNLPPLKIQSSQLDVSAYGSLAYRMKRSSLAVTYQRLTTSGSGLFTGANTDAVQGSLSGRISKSWSLSLNSGYASLRALQKNSQTPSGGSYQYVYVGAACSRRIGAHFSFVASYQFNNDFVSTACNAASGCVGRQNTALIGLAWHPRPIRLGEGSSRLAQPGYPNSTNDNQQPANDTSTGTNDGVTPPPPAPDMQ